MPEKKDELEQLRDAYRSDPQNKDSASRLAQLYTDRGWQNESIKLYKELITAYPDDFPLLLAYGNLCFSRQDITESLRIFKKITVLKPTRVEGWNNLGIVQLACEDYTNAKHSFQKVLEIEPDNHGALLNMGNYYDHIGNDEKAIALFKRATAVKPDFSDAWFNLGNARAKKDQFHKAIDAYEKALKYNPKFYSALKNLGFAFEKLEEYDKAEEYYQKALAENRADASLYVNIAMLSMKQKKLDRAKEYFLNAVKLAPKNADGWLGLRDLSLQKGDIKTYVKSTRAILHRLDARALAESLQTLRRLGQHESIDALVKAVDVLSSPAASRDELDAERMLAYTRTKNGTDKGKESLLYKRLSGIARPSDHVLQCLAAYCYHTKQYDQAVRYVQAMKDTESIEALSIQWNALIASGASESVERIIQTFLRTHQDCFEAWYQLARIHARQGNLEQAREFLIRALDSGFSDFDKLEEEPNLKKLYETLVP